MNVGGDMVMCVLIVAILIWLLRDKIWPTK